MNEIVNFDYNGAIVPFELTGKEVMINATAMASACGKNVGHFLSNQSTKDLIQTLSSDIGIPISEIVVVVKGGIPQNQGTWMHRKIAIAFAMWCSPAFYHWCVSKIDEIISNGYAVRDNEIATLRGAIAALQPKVDFFEEYLANTQTTYSLTEIVKVSNFSVTARDVFSGLENRGFIMRCAGNKWHLKKPWSDFGYTKFMPYTKKDPVTGAIIYTGGSTERWTEEGRFWLCSMARRFGWI